MAYSDSVLYSLPIVTDAEGGHVVDFTRAFMNDDQMIGRSIGVPGPPFHFVRTARLGPRSKSSRTTSNSASRPSIAGCRTCRRSSIRAACKFRCITASAGCPATDYKPRKADDRVGYFLTVRKNFSDKEDDQHFVRYINRWNLKKESPDSTVSAPVKPITFYIEKTVPKNLRP